MAQAIHIQALNRIFDGDKTDDIPALDDDTSRLLRHKPIAPHPALPTALPRVA